MTRTLNIHFSSKALETLGQQKKRVVVVKESNEALPDDNAVIAWFTTTPFQEMKITWEEEFYLYGSQTEFQAGAVIEKTSSTDKKVNDKNYLYQFGPKSATFKGETYTQGKAGTIYMKNLFADGDFTLFGLAQKITCSGKNHINPINAVESILNDNIAFTPVEKIRVFLQANVQDAKVLTAISSDPISLNFTGNTEQAIRYDEEKNCFVEE